MGWLEAKQALRGDVGRAVGAQNGGMNDVRPGGTDMVDCGEQGADAMVAEGATRPENEERPKEDRLREPGSTEDLTPGRSKKTP